MRRIRFIAIILAATMLLASLYYRSAHLTLSLALGAAIVIASFELLGFIIGNALGAKNPPKLFLVLAAVTKFMIIGLLLWFLVVKLGVEPVAFLAGLTTIVLAIIIEAVVRIVRKEPCL